MAYMECLGYVNWFVVVFFADPMSRVKLQYEGSCVLCSSSCWLERVFVSYHDVLCGYVCCVCILHGFCLMRFARHPFSPNGLSYKCNTMHTPSNGVKLGISRGRPLSSLP